MRVLSSWPGGHRTVLAWGARLLRVAAAPGRPPALLWRPEGQWHLPGPGQELGARATILSSWPVCGPGSGWSPCALQPPAVCTCTPPAGGGRGPLTAVLPCWARAWRASGPRAVPGLLVCGTPGCKPTPRLLTAAGGPACMPGKSAPWGPALLSATLRILTPHCPPWDSAPLGHLSTAQAGASLTATHVKLCSCAPLRPHCPPAGLGSTPCSLSSKGSPWIPFSAPPALQQFFS